jgi:large conductance mechanosensitive channel
MEETEPVERRDKRGRRLPDPEILIDKKARARDRAKHVNAMVEAVLMPGISALVGSPNFDSFAVVSLNGNDIRFGVLLTALVNFLLVAAAVYVAVVLPMNRVLEARNRRLGIDPDVEEADAQVQLLTEIRDALRRRT